MEEAQFRCPKCIERGRETQGPVSRFRSRLKESGLSVACCRQCAIDDAKGSVEANGGILRRLHGTAEGETKDRVGTLVALWNPEVGDVWSGKAKGMNGKGSFVRAQDRASDLVALARLTLAQPIMGKAKAAHTQLTTSDVELDAKGEALLAVLGNNLEAAQQELDAGWGMVGDGDIVDPAKPPKMQFRDRRAFWGRARRALEGVQGMATTFGQMATGDGAGVERAKHKVEEIFGGKGKMREFFETMEAEEKEGAQELTEESLSKLNKPDLVALAESDFKLKPDAKATKADLIKAIMQAQEKAKATAAA